MRGNRASTDDSMAVEAGSNNHSPGHAGEANSRPYPRPSRRMLAALSHVWEEPPTGDDGQATITYQQDHNPAKFNNVTLCGHPKAHRYLPGKDAP